MSHHSWRAERKAINSKDTTWPKIRGGEEEPKKEKNFVPSSSNNNALSSRALFFSLPLSLSCVAVVV